jgi:hypothetical protein
MSESPRTIGSAAVPAAVDDELLDDELLDAELVELVDDVSPDPLPVEPGSFFPEFPGLAGFPCAEAPVTTTAISDTTRASASASFRKTISSP